MGTTINLVRGNVPWSAELLAKGPLCSDDLPQDDPEAVDVGLLAALPAVDELWGRPLKGALEISHHCTFVHQDLGQAHVLCMAHTRPSRLQQIDPSMTHIQTAH